jgi:AraC-like DNA-binding protein
MANGVAEEPAALGGVLGRFACVVSRDLDEVRAGVGRVFCEHRLRLAGAACALDTRLYYRPLRSLGIGRMSYGAAVDIDPGMLRDFYLLQMPTRGHEAVEVAGQRVWSTPGTASLVSPQQDFRMRHGADTEKLFLRVERAALERQYSRLYGQPLQGTLAFAPGIALDAGPGSSVRRLLQWLAGEASGGLLLEQTLCAASIEDMVLTALLDGLPHNQRPTPASASMGVSPRVVRRARDFIEQHIDEALCVGDIAAHVGVSARGLHFAFRKYNATTPMAYLRDLRLDRVRADLLRGDDTGAAHSVTATAVRWGFTHLGQFAASYRRRFGELPSQTRQRARH